MLVVALPSDDLGPYLVMDAVTRIRRQEGLPATPLARPPLPSLGLLPAKPIPEQPESHLEPGVWTLGRPIPQGPLEPWLASLCLPGWLDPRPIVGTLLEAEVDDLARQLKGHESVLCCGAHEAADALSAVPYRLHELGGPLPNAVIPTKLLWPATGLELGRQHLTTDSLRLAMAAEDTQRFHILDNPWTAWFDLVLTPEALPSTLHSPPSTLHPFHAELQRLWDDAREHRDPQTFSLKRQVQLLEELALRGLHLAERHPEEPNLAATALAVWARLAEPIMPELAGALAECLGTTLKADPECRPLQSVPLKPLQARLSTRQDALALKAARLGGI